MKRKGWIRLLSVVAALMLPMSAIAQSAAMDWMTQADTEGKEIVTTITFEPGATLATDPAVADMSAATVIRINKLAGGYGAFAVVLNGVDSIAAQFHAATDGIFVQSETLGTQPLYFSWEDINKGMTEAMSSSGMGETGMNQFSQGFMQGFTTGKGMMDGTVEPTKLTQEEMYQKITEAMGGDEGFVNWMKAIQAKAVVTNGEFTLGDSDTADTKTEILVTKEDIASLYDVTYIQKQVATQIKSKDATLTDEQVTAETAKQIEAIKVEVLASDVTLPITLYTKGTDDLIAVEWTMTGTFTNDATDTTAFLAADTAEPTATPVPAAPAKINVHMTMARKTLADGKQYTANMTATKDDQAQFTMNGLLTKNDKTMTGTLTMNGDKADQQVAFDLSADYTDAKHVFGKLNVSVNDKGALSAVVLGFDQVVGDTTVDNQLSLAYGESIEAITAAGDAAVLGTIKVNCVKQDNSGTFATISEATPATSLEVMKLSETDLQTYLSTLQSNAMQTLYKVLGNLPQSVSSQLMGSTTGN